MRPNTLSAAYDRIILGESHALAYANFLDMFYGLGSRAEMSQALRDEPAPCGDPKLDALAGAVAEYLAKRHGADVLGWCGAPIRYLPEPWFTAPSAGPGMVEYLVHSSPAEFRSRNIFTEPEPLRRASERGYRAAG